MMYYTLFHTVKLPFHCEKSIRIRSFSGPYFPAFELNMERNLFRFSPNARKCGPEKLQIWTLSRKCSIRKFLDSIFRYLRVVFRILSHINT